MGDPRRFNTFGTAIEERFSYAKSLRVADVAGGLGYLQKNLLERGYNNVTTFDKRYKHLQNLKYNHRYFSCENISFGFDLLVGMHPDEGTDHIILAAGKMKIPFIICPCCIKPSATVFNLKYKYNNWFEHLCNLAEKTHTIEINTLKIRGRRDIIVGFPIL